MPTQRLQVTYLGGEYRIPAVALIERAVGVRDAYVEISSDGYLDLFVKNSYRAEYDKVRYSAADVECYFGVNNIWQSMGMLDVGPSKFVIRVKGAEPVGGTLEVTISMARKWSSYFIVAMGHAGFQQRFGKMRLD